MLAYRNIACWRGVPPGQDATIVNLVAGTNAILTRSTGPVTLGGVTSAAGSNQVLTVALTATPAGTQVLAAGTSVGVQFPLTIADQSGITSGSGSVNWNLGASTDRTIEQ